ncbi:MAG: D-alanyl-D-alanine carboxypeptidase family protein [Alphaproteobacteria bacterium]
MRLRWFCSITAAAALAVTTLTAGPDLSMSPATAASKPRADTATAGKAKPPIPLEIIGPIDTQARAALVMEAETDTVLLDKNSDERIPPASMSKLMTAYVVFRYLKEGRATLDDELPVSEKAWRTGGSKMFVPLGARIKISDLIRGMVVQSGNDACVVLAEGLAGSEAAFVEEMNRVGKEIGLKNSHFANVDGLPHPDHWMTARDLATVAVRTIKDFPELYKLYSEKEFTFNKITQGNRNPLLYKDLGADGLKTGHTEEAGYSLVGSAKRGDRRVLLVLSGLPSSKARAQESERLIEWAFREYNTVPLFTAGATVDEAEVWLGEQPKVTLTVAEDLVVTVPRRSRKDMKVTVAYDQPVAAPIKEGQPLGRIVITVPGIEPVETPLIAANDVGRMGPFGRIATVAGHMIWGSWN